MENPEAEQARIPIPSLCYVGGHVFTYTSSSTYEGSEPPPSLQLYLRCSCGLYTWHEWAKVMEGA